MDNVVVHPRVMERHPELTEEDTISAWKNAMVARHRVDNEADRVVVLGSDARGRLVEMVANQLPNGIWVIFHAMTPPSRATLVELGMTRR